jgi:hypothetical protein
MGPEDKSLLIEYTEYTEIFKKPILLFLVLSTFNFLLLFCLPSVSSVDSVRPKPFVYPSGLSMWS